MAGRIWHLHVERESAGSVLILTISGRAGSAAAHMLESALGEATRAGCPVVVDLTAVDYMSGPSLAALQAAAEGRNGTFVLCGVTQPVQIALELAGMFSDFAVEPTRSAAVARAARGSGR